jgi:D-tyrosyl-tRNA(Tyr) deacylase
VRVVVQRVTAASVVVDGEVVGEVGRGLCLLVGIARGDSIAQAEQLAARLWGLRIFEDSGRRMNLSAQDLGLEMLVVSQFTLCADVRRGRRPSFVDAASPEVAQPIVEHFAEHLRRLGARVATGRFGAPMSVTIANDGPVTLVVDG